MDDALDLDALEATAKGATPGPWTLGHAVGQCHIKHAHGASRGCKYDYHFSPPSDGDGYGHRSVVSVPALTQVLAETSEYPDASREDAAFIAAANPATVLALIARCRAAEQRADNAEGQVREVRGLWFVSAILAHVRSEHRGPVAVGTLPYEDCERLTAALAPRAEATPEREVES